MNKKGLILGIIVISIIIGIVASMSPSTDEILDVDMGADTNRTVVTIIGSPEVISEAAFQAVKKASEVIDMSKHKLNSLKILLRKELCE